MGSAYKRIRLDTSDYKFYPASAILKKVKVNNYLYLDSFVNEVQEITFIFKSNLKVKDYKLNSNSNDIVELYEEAYEISELLGIGKAQDNLFKIKNHDEFIEKLIKLEKLKKSNLKIKLQKSPL